ncbi:MAG: response regulator [candidate division Zixibacteria bacterium]|nr:response regulator [candidate division Zixibacteria bacterium]
MELKASVLIVDDEKCIRDILSRIIEREGFMVTVAVDGSDAYEKIQKARYDYVISDINMPNMTGLELLKKIKGLNRKIRVLLITSRAGEYSPHEILREGADFFITKPFKNAEIARTLRSLECNRQRQIKKENDKKAVPA